MDAQAGNRQRAKARVEPSAPAAPAVDPVAALREVQQASAAATAELARRLGVGTTDVAALEHISWAAEPLGPAGLGDRLGITSASATTLVDRLERSGHVRRAPHPRDRRRQTLSVTGESTAQTMTALEPLRRDIAVAAAALTVAETEAVVRFLHAAAAAMRRYAGASAELRAGEDGTGTVR